MSHRNNQPLLFFNSLTWYEVWYPSSDIPLWISANIPLAEEVDFLTPLTGSHELYKKNIKSVNYTLFSSEPNDVIYCLLLSRVITEPYFNFIPCAEIKVYGGAYPIPSSNNHLCSTLNQLRCVFQNLLSIHAN